MKSKKLEKHDIKELILRKKCRMIIFLKEQTPQVVSELGDKEFLNKYKPVTSDILNMVMNYLVMLEYKIVKKSQKSIIMSNINSRVVAIMEDGKPSSITITKYK